MKFAIFSILFVIAAVSAKEGSISLRNSGGFVAKFSLQYDLNGRRETAESGDQFLEVTKIIKIPDGATNINVKAEYYWWPGSLATIFTKSFPEPVQQCYQTWGTTLDAKYKDVNC